MAARPPEIRFGPFHLDPATGGLRKEGSLVPLQPRPLAVLRYLAERPGRVVATDELLREVWAGTFVTRGVLKVAVRAIREALGDQVASPRYLETVGRDGYRLLDDPASPAQRSAATARARPRPMVGRGADLERLREAFRESSEGSPRIVLVAGEAGIGKTTLLDHFLAGLEARAEVRVARGQCLERHGLGEPYLPVLEALGRLCRDGRAEWLASALRRHAPSWIEQLPGLAGGAGPRLTDPRSPAERMLRELADALAVATSERSLVLALEDLHWCDEATLDLISCLAQRREPARLLLVASYRPSDVIAYAHPLRQLKRQLLARSQCQELVLELLGLAEIAEYLRLRLGESADLEPLARALHARTAGNPLFATSVVEDLLARGLIVDAGGAWRLATSAGEAAETVPGSVQQLIEHQADRLPEEDRALLEAASAAGIEFAVASLAAALQRDADELETRCEELAALGHFIEPAGLAEWPDGTLCGRYRFRHPLRGHVLYRRLPAPRRIRLHRAIAHREEAGYGSRAAEIAAELAAHFELGHEPVPAVKHREIAGHTALRCQAPREAAAHFEHALRILATLPDSRARQETELALRVALAAPLMALRGYAAPEVGESYERARVLCGALGDRRELLPVLRGLVSHRQVRLEFGAARALGEELLALAAAAGDSVARVQAHYGHGVTLFHAGEPEPARAQLECALDLYRPEQHPDHVLHYGGYDPGVACRLWRAWTLQVLGLPEQGRRSAIDGLALARKLGHPLTHAFACYGAAITHQTLGEWDESQPLADQAIALGEANGFAYELAIATILRGWTLVLRGRVAEGTDALRNGCERYTATGARLSPASTMLLAAAEAMSGRLEAAYELARGALAEARAREPGLDTVEVRCGAARILLARAPTRPGPERAHLEEEAESLLASALAAARAQRAPFLQLLAARELARLWSARDGCAEARDLLAPIVACFSEGLETRDLRQAARLLARLR